MYLSVDGRRRLKKKTSTARNDRTGKGQEVTFFAFELKKGAQIFQAIFMLFRNMYNSSCVHNGLYDFPLGVAAGILMPWKIFL